jgi:hypothetical protein
MLARADVDRREGGDELVARPTDVQRGRCNQIGCKHLRARSGGRVERDEAQLTVSAPRVHQVSGKHYVPCGGRW